MKKWLSSLIVFGVLTTGSACSNSSNPSSENHKTSQSQLSYQPAQEKPNKAQTNTQLSGSVKSTQTSKQSSLLNVSAEWPSFGNNLWQDRYSPDKTITPKTVNKLSLAFKKTLPDTKGENESYPLEEKGVLYLTAPGSRVFVLDASMGKTLWSFSPKITLSHYTKANRGVALGPNRVFVLTPDDRLIALDKNNGKLLFDVKAASLSEGYFESMAPQYADGKVFVGSSGGDMGVRGFIEAFDAKTGKKLWRFFTIPERGKGWVPKEGNHGGGAVWTTPTFDPESNTLLFGSGNPSPDYFGEARKGKNLYTDSVISVGASNGKLVWNDQEEGHDLWDYDVASPPLMFNLDGKRIVGEAGKDGFWYEWTAEEGKPVIDPVAFVKQDHSPPTPNGTKEWPGPAGGANYGPSAYDPELQTVFVAGIDGPEIIYGKPTQHKGYSPDFGTHQNLGQTKDWKGTVTAIDAKTGKKKWQLHIDSPPIGGLTVNAGGVVFFGQANGELDGVNAKTGEVVWQEKTSTSIGSAPILYNFKGKTYLTYLTGGAGSLLRLFPSSIPNDVRAYTLK